MSLTRIIFLFQLGAALCLFQFGQTSAFAQPSDDPAIPSEDRIHPGDLIEIDEMGGFDFDWRGRIDAEGFLDGFTKVADPIFALCRSPKQLADAVREAYGKTLRDPRVQVRILDRSQRPVAIVDGAVRQPMRLQIRRPVRLSELAVLSGGFTDRASGEITLLRPANRNCVASNEPTSIVSIQTSDILSGKEGANLQVMSGDIVTVRTVEPVYVIGGVNRPGRVDWRQGSTISRIVAGAGGVADRGVAGKVSIFRRTKDGSDVIEVDLDQVVSGKNEDVEIRPLDIVEVPLKGSSKRTGPPIVESIDPARSTQSLPIRIID